MDVLSHGFNFFFVANEGNNKNALRAVPLLLCRASSRSTPFDAAVLLRNRQEGTVDRAEVW